MGLMSNICTCIYFIYVSVGPEIITKQETLWMQYFFSINIYLGFNTLSLLVLTEPIFHYMGQMSSQGLLLFHYHCYFINNEPTISMLPDIDDDV